MHGHRIHQLVLEFDVGEFARVQRASPLRATAGWYPSHWPCRPKSPCRGVRARLSNAARAMRSISGRDVDAKVAGDVGAVALLLAIIGAAHQFAEHHEIDAARRFPPSAACGRRAPDALRPGAHWRKGQAPCVFRASPALGPALGACSHFGPPTAPSSTASAAWHASSVVRRQRIAGSVDAGAADRMGCETKLWS